MFDYQINSFLREETHTGRYNFSMKESEYMPITNADMQNMKIFPDLNSPIIALKEIKEIINANRYFLPYFSNWQHDHQPPIIIDVYQKFATRFYSRIPTLEEIKFSFRERLLSQSHYESDKLQKLSYLRFHKGQLQNVQGVKYNFSKHSIGAFKEKNAEKSDVFYLLTFKTKYLEELQEALYTGKPFNNIWFTLFLNPNVPGLAVDDKFTNPFVTQFIAPFEQKGIEVKFDSDILENLAYQECPLPYVFSLTTRGRTKQKTEKEQLLADFLIAKKTSIIDQENWNMGVISNKIAEEALRVYQATAIIKLFGIHLDETIYNGVSLEEGMQRLLLIGDNHELQIYSGEKWEIIDNTRVTQFNALKMVFSIFIHMNTREIVVSETFLDDEPIMMKYEAFNMPDRPYKGQEVLYNLQALHEISEYRIKEVPFSSGLIYPYHMIENISNNLYYNLDESIPAYKNSMDLMNISWADIRYTLNHVLVLTTGDKIAEEAKGVENNTLVYLVDEDNLYFIKEGLFFKIDFANDQINIVNVIASFTVSFASPMLEGIYRRRLNEGVLCIHPSRSFLWSPIFEDVVESDTTTPVLYTSRVTLEGETEFFRDGVLVAYFEIPNGVTVSPIEDAVIEPRRRERRRERPPATSATATPDSFDDMF